MSMNSKVDVAVVVPVYNRLDLLKETVESLRAQTARSARFVMVDDHSADETLEYLRALPREDDRFVLIEKRENQPQGCQLSRNIGLDACNSSAVVFLDSDDLLAPRALDARYRVLSESPDADIVVGPQAIFSDEMECARWVNVPRSDINELDRFLAIASPIDVPWVNGGAMFRTSSLNESNIRWRPEFDWDDVAFHFEGLVAGLKPVWMSFDGGPDSWYRMHNGPRYGNTLGTIQGIQSAARMISWMNRELMSHHLASDARQAALVRALFRACVLPAIDTGRGDAAREMIRAASEEGLMSAAQAKKLSTYASGRQRFSISHRATGYWNRFSDRRLLTTFIENGTSTYGSIAVNSRSKVTH